MNIIYIFLVILLLKSSLSLYIYQPHLSPSLIKSLPHITLGFDRSQVLDLKDYYEGFNLSFFFNDFKDPYLTFSYSQALSYSTPRPFDSGFSQLMIINPDNINDDMKIIILTKNQQIYSVSMTLNEDDVNFIVNNFSNLPQNLNCSAVVTINATQILIDCYNESNNSGVFLLMTLPINPQINPILHFNNSYPFDNPDKTLAYALCAKALKYKQGLLFRFCKDRKNSFVSGVLEVFSYQNESNNLQFLLLIDDKTFDFELFIQDLTIYNVISSEDFEFFILDDLMGPCTVRHVNKTTTLFNDFPEILGENYFFIEYLEVESQVLITSGHYISEISLKDNMKSLKKRVNFGDSYKIDNIRHNQEYYFVHLSLNNEVQEVQKSGFLNIFNRNSEKTDLLYQLPTELFDILEYLPIKFNDTTNKLLLYNIYNNNFRVLTLSSNIINISCCQHPVISPLISSPLLYNKSLEFSVYNFYDDRSQNKIFSKLNISIASTSMPQDDSMGFRFFILDRQTLFAQKEFFFLNEEIPFEFQKNAESLGVCYEDHLDIGIEDDSKDFAMITSERVAEENYYKQAILGNSRNLPLLKLNKLSVKFNNSFEENCSNPLALGFIDFPKMTISLDFQQKIDKNYDENQCYLVETKLIIFETDIEIRIFPDLSTIGITYSQDFLNNLANNITNFDIASMSSLNLDSFFNGLIEEYSFTYEDNGQIEENNTLYLEKYMEENTANYTFPNKTDAKTLYFNDYAFIFADNAIDMIGLPPLYSNYQNMSTLRFSTITQLFDTCSKIFLHDTLPLLISYCESTAQPKRPKRLIFIRFDEKGFNKIIKQIPIPDDFGLISDMIFLENVMFLIEKNQNSLNESVINVFLMDNSSFYSDINENHMMKNYVIDANAVKRNINEQKLDENQENNHDFLKINEIPLENSNLTNNYEDFSIPNSLYLISDIKNFVYQRLNAESFNVDYLIFDIFQVKIFGHLGNFMSVGLFFNDDSKLYYTEFVINISTVENRNFINNINNLQNFPLNELLGNYSHELYLINKFNWIKTDEFGIMSLVVSNQFNLMEIGISRFNINNYEILRQYQSFYSCFHTSDFQNNDNFFVEFCEFSTPGDQQIHPQLYLQLYTKTKDKYSNILQMMSFKSEIICDIYLKGMILLISLKNGTIINFKLKSGISLEKLSNIKGNSIINGTFHAINRYSNASVYIRIQPEMINDQSIDVKFFILIVLPIIAAFLGIFCLFIVIYWSRKKRKEFFLSKLKKKSIISSSEIKEVKEENQELFNN